MPRPYPSSVARSKLIRISPWHMRNLGLAYSAVGESVLSAESTTRAWQLRERVSERERFFIDFTYDRQVTGNLEKAYQTLELWLQTYPRGREPPDPQDLLAGLSTHGTGRFERAIEAAQKKSRPIPTSSSGMAIWRPAISSWTASPKPRARFSEPPSASWRTPTLLSDPIQHRVLEGRQGPDGSDSGSGQGQAWSGTLRWRTREALALARSGRLQLARRSSSRAVDLALQEGGREEAASYQAARAVWEAVCGNAAEAKRNAIGGAGAFERPRCRIRRRPCPGSFGRLLSIASARR